MVRRRSGSDFAAEGDFHPVDDRASWKIEDVGEIDAGLEADVVDDTRGGIVKMELHRLMKQGRPSLLIGIAFRTSCLLVKSYLLPHFDGPRNGCAQ